MNIFKKFLSVVLCVGLLGAAGQMRCSEISKAILEAEKIVLEASFHLEDIKRFSSNSARSITKGFVKEIGKNQDLQFVLREIKERNKEVAQLKANIKKEKGESKKDKARSAWLIEKNKLDKLVLGLADGLAPVDKICIGINQCSKKRLIEALKVSNIHLEFLVRKKKLRSNSIINELIDF